MEASTVYYTDFRCPVGTSLTDKLRRLCIAAGIKNIDMEGKFVAIKMHFGELGNLAYLFGRPLASIYAPGEEEVIRQALVRLSFICCPYLLGGFMDTMVGGLRGIGYSVIPMIVSLVGACGLRLVWVATVFPLFHSPATLYFSYPVTWTITGLTHLIFFLCVRKRAYARLEHPDPVFRAN